MPIVDFSQAVRTARSVDGLYESLIRMVNSAFPSKAVTLFVRDEDTGHYSCRISTQPYPDTEGTPTLAKDAFVVRRLRGLDSPMQLDAGDLKAWKDALIDAPAEVFEKRMRERQTLEQTQSSLLVQLKTRNELVGVLSLGESSFGRFSTKDHEILKGMAGQLALVIENAKLAERLVEHQKLQAELELAAEVQRSLLPISTPDIQDFDLCGFCKPAQQIGGDYYDFIPLGVDRTGLAIADVAGKGISAALLMSVVQATLRGQLLNGLEQVSIASLVKMLNRLICGSVSTSRYVTFFYAELNRRTGRVRFVNAGHNPPVLLVRKSETGNTHLLNAGGPVLGVFPDAQFEEGSFELQSGDLLVAYTDGLTEAMNSAGEEFGEERLCAAIAGLNEGTAKDALDQLVHQVTTWSKGTRQHDDITVLVLKRS